LGKDEVIAMNELSFKVLGDDEDSDEDEW